MIPAQLISQLAATTEGDVLVVGGRAEDLDANTFSGRSVWRVSSEAALAPGFHRSITGELLSLAVGSLPLHHFGLTLVLGDLPFGKDLPAFLRRLKALSGPCAKLAVVATNPLSSEKLGARFAGGFELESQGSFTPVELRVALAGAGFRLELELAGRGAGEGGNVDTPTDGLSSILETTFVTSIAEPAVDRAHRLGPGTTGVRTSIVVLTYNSETSIRECLDSALTALGPDEEILVVDNASQDETCEMVEKLAEGRDQLRLIRNDANLGFSAGCNVGILASRGEFVALLNPDTIVWHGWTRALQAPFEHPSVGMVGPLSDRIAGDQFVGHHVSLHDAPKSLTDLASVVGQKFANRTSETKLLIGLCAMLRRDVLQRVGLLDEDLYLGSDDLELSWRIRTHGLKLVVAKSVFVQHLGGVSFSSLDSSHKSRLLYESTEALLAKLRSYYGWNPPDRCLWGIDITHQ